MSGFRKAKAMQASVKMMLYGSSGRGKTLTALLIAEALASIDGKRVALIDTERGTDFYVAKVPERTVHPDAFDVDAIYTKSISEIGKAVSELGDEHGVIVLDSVTHLWEAALAGYAGKKTKSGTIPMHAWGKIKAPYKALLSRLINDQRHIVLCAREGSEYAEDEDSGEIRRIGAKAKCEGETPYEPHILIRLEQVRLGKGEQFAIEAVVEKDRSGKLGAKTYKLWPVPPGKELTHTVDTLVRPLLPLLGHEQAAVMSADDAGVIDADANAARDAERATKSAERFRKFQSAFLDADTEDEVSAIAKGITTELKRMMLDDHVAALRELFQQSLTRVQGERLVMESS